MGIDGLDSLKPGNDDIAPDADEPGDQVAPELEEFLTHPDGIVPDEVDQPDPDEYHRNMERIDE